MKKLLIPIIVAAVAALSFSTTADAAKWRWGGGGHWRGHGHWHGHGYRHYGHRWHGHGRWYGGRYWGPGIVIAPGFYGGGYYDDYCYVRKVRRYDANGNAYVRRVRVCD